MNKNKILAAILSLTLAVCTLTACGNASEPGKKNDGLVSESPDSIELVDDKDKTKAEDVTAITGETDLNGKVVDSEGILDTDGHKIYATGQKDSAGLMIYTTGKYASNGKIIYTKNQTDSFGHTIYYTGEYVDGKLVLTPTQEVPDYTKNDKPTKPNKTTTTEPTKTVGAEIKSDITVTDAKTNYTKFFGGTGIDVFKAVSPCKKGGFVVAAYSQSSNGDFDSTDKTWKGHSAVVKYANDCSVEWKYIIGGDNEISLDDVTELKDGSVIAAGYTMATDIDAPKTAKDSSALIVRLTKDGELMWMYSFPNDADQSGDYISAVAATPDGGFVVGGKATTNAGFFNTGATGKNSKAFLIKFDKNCNVKWRKVLTATKSNNFAAVDVNDDGDIFATCVTTSTDGDFANITLSSAATKNTVLMKFNKKGDLQWSDYLVGSGNSEYTAVKATSDGGCIVGGSFTVLKKADGIYSMTYGKSDGYVIRYNEKGEACWARVVGGSGADYIYGITEVEGGYAAVGRTTSADRDFQGLQVGGQEEGFLIYLNEKGQTTAKMLITGSESEAVLDVCTLDDGTIAVAGWTKSSDGDFKNSKAAKQAMAFVSKYTAETKENKKDKEGSTK